MSGQSSRGPTIVRLGRSYSSEETNFLANLRRTNTSNPWGFRMLGGVDQGSCLYVHKVNPKSIAERSGMRPGDGIMAVSGVSTNGMTHDQAKMEILRAGNELDFYLSRNAMPVSSETVKRQESMEETRAEIIEDPSDFNTGYQNPNVQSRSFKILQEALSYTEAPDDVAIYRFRQSPGQDLAKTFLALNLITDPESLVPSHVSDEQGNQSVSVLNDTEKKPSLIPEPEAGLSDL